MLTCYNTNLTWRDSFMASNIFCLFFVVLCHHQWHFFFFFFYPGVINFWSYYGNKQKWRLLTRSGLTGYLKLTFRFFTLNFKHYKNNVCIGFSKFNHSLQVTLKQSSRRCDDHFSGNKDSDGFALIPLKKCWLSGLDRLLEVKTRGISKAHKSGFRQQCAAPHVLWEIGNLGDWIEHLHHMALSHSG